MTHASTRQRLSDLLDQEVESASLDSILARLSDDTDLRAQWSRYHLIRGALRGEPVSARYQGVAEGVARRIRQEDERYPGAANPESGAERQIVPKSEKRKKSRSIWPGSDSATSLHWWPLAGAGVLAGLTALGSVSLLHQSAGAGHDRGPALAAARQYVPLPSINKTSPISAPGVATADWMRQDALANSLTSVEPALNAHMSQLLIDHQEHASVTSIKGFLPYATLVGYGTQH